MPWAILDSDIYIGHWERGLYADGASPKGVHRPHLLSGELGIRVVVLE
jgi:hypothetical protein